MELSTNVQHHSCACPRSLRKSSLPVLFTILSWITLVNRSNLRTNSFTIARQLLSSSITAYYVPSITDVVWFCYYYDLSTAFDTVDHNLLLSRLEPKFSIRGKALQWFISYLSQRSQFDCIYRAGYILSPELNCGKPQGQVQSSTFSTHHLWLTFFGITIWLSIFTLMTPSCMLLSHK